MLKCTCDIAIFDDFIKNQPQKEPVGNEDDNKAWNSLWYFLKSGADLELVNMPDNYENIFLNSLTTGRAGSSLSTNSNFNHPHKCTFKKDTEIDRIFFINEELEEKQRNYLKNNGHFIAFQNNYLEKWKQFSFFNKPRQLSARKNATLKFYSWNQLNDYAVNFTDLIIVDSYVFSDESLLHSNLYRIIEILSSWTQIRFNLLIVSYVGGKIKVNAEKCHEKIKDFCIQKNIKCNIGIVLSTSELKEHDRIIYSNYIRIKSGDSFCYFNSANDFVTKGTDIDFFSYTEPNLHQTALDGINRIKEIIENLKNRYPENIAGTIDNRLIN